MTKKKNAQIDAWNGQRSLRTDFGFQVCIIVCELIAVFESFRDVRVKVRIEEEELNTTLSSQTKDLAVAETS